MIDGAEIKRLAAWLVERGLAGVPEPELLASLCARLVAAGVPLCRASLIVDTLHPVHEGRAFRWRSDGVEEAAVIEYGRTDAGEAAEQWRRTTFHHLDETGATELRRRLLDADAMDFPVFDELRAEGRTDYLACRHLFSGADTIAGMDRVYSSWMSDHPAGFDDDDLEALRRLVPVLVLAIQSVSLGRVARTLVEVYLGRDAGARVLSGRIRRGVADKIRAVLWFSDLKGFTTITDRADPGEIIPFLNDYAEAVIGAVHRVGGDVLKLIGDGVLAIFAADQPAEACRAALQAEADLRADLVRLAEKRKAEGRPVAEVTLGLHIGEVFFGNIGSDDRLDFTVVGPAVNEVSRIASLCRSVDRLILVSSEFVAATPEPLQADLVSVGRYALRGVGRAEHLYTIDPVVFAERGRGNASPAPRLPSIEVTQEPDMSNTEKNQPDSAAIDASISVLGEEGGEPKVASIEGSVRREGSASVERPEAGRAGAQENLEAPLLESEEALRSPDGGSVERPGRDPGPI